MSVILLAAAFALGGAAGALVVRYVLKQQPKAPALTEGTYPPVEHPLPPNAHKFRVVFYTQRGAYARDLYKQLEPSPQPHHAELVELWHFSDVRSRKP
jgi:hypothetical protein